MKSLRFERFGAPSVLSLQTLQLPVPSEGEVLIEVHASGINPSDVKNIAGRFHATLPRTPGRDFAGVVVQGPREALNKEVWGSGAGLGVNRDGSHAEYLTLPVSWLAGKPADLSMAQAASAGIPYVTAWTALIGAAEIRERETLLITGVAGSVGRAAAQIARWKGAEVIGAGRGKATPGIEKYIDSENEDIVARVRELTGGVGVDVALDTVGGPLFEVSLRSLRIGGRKIAITAQGNGRVEFSLVDFYHNMSRLIGVDTVKLTGPEIADIMQQLKAGFEGGYLRTGEILERSFAEAIQSYEDLDAGRIRQKQVLVMK
jgi:NADPH:quinone reductase